MTTVEGCLFWRHLYTWGLECKYDSLAASHNMGKSEQRKHFSSASIPSLFSQTGTDLTASYLTGLSWSPTSRDGWQARAQAPNASMLPWKLFMKTLQPLLRDRVGVEHSVFAARQLCQCFTVRHCTAVDFFPLCGWSKWAYYGFPWMTEDIHH